MRSTSYESAPTANDEADRLISSHLASAGKQTLCLCKDKFFPMVRYKKEKITFWAKQQNGRRKKVTFTARKPIKKKGQ